MRVALVSYTSNPEFAIAAAARLCYSPVSATEILEKLTPGKVDSFLAGLLQAGHLSPFENANFTFAIEGISRATSHQLVRHRIASFSQQSQRYVSFRNLPYVTPDSIAAVPEMKVEYERVVDEAHKLYCRMMEAGIPAEDARFILPNAASTNLVMTMNARELMHVCSVRLCLRAQWEIVHLFELVKIEVQKVAPRIAQQMKPKCYSMGFCDEHESCGLIPTLG